MGAGIILPTSSMFNMIASKFQINYDYTDPTIKLDPFHKPWTPPQYSQPALTVLVQPAIFDKATGKPITNPTNWVFDAVLRINHRRVLTKTQHPVLTGASISDHAFMQPNAITLEIGMSDVMAAYTSDMWVGAATKSVSAWQVIKNLQVNRVLLTVLTRLDAYPNMIIESVTSTDTNVTLHGLRALINLSEVISAGVTSTPVVSARPQTTLDTIPGTIAGVDPDPVLLDQHMIPSVEYPDASQYHVLGSGVFSSNNLGDAPAPVPPKLVGPVGPGES
jgi:hypothetical protein